MWYLQACFVESISFSILKNGGLGPHQGPIISQVLSFWGTELLASPDFKANQKSGWLWNCLGFNYWKLVLISKKSAWGSNRSYWETVCGPWMPEAIVPTSHPVIPGSPSNSWSVVSVFYMCLIQFNIELPSFKIQTQRTWIRDWDKRVGLCGIFLYPVVRMCG